MSEVLFAQPDCHFGPYPLRPVADPGLLERWDLAAQRNRIARRRGSFRRFGRTLARIHARALALQRLSDGDRILAIDALRAQLHRRGLNDAAAVEAFALVSCATSAALGLELYDEQFFAGWLMLHGLLAEMQTGEGKTLAACLPACTAALAGSPVHVITTNDYLVARDAGDLAALYHWMGLTVAPVTAASGAQDRRTAYRQDVTYVSNKQIVFDYLRDRQQLSEDPTSLSGRLQLLLERPVGATNQDAPMLPGLCFAIVDEADSVLIDDARTPLILSSPLAFDPAAHYAVAIGLARRLNQDHDYSIDQNQRQVSFTDTGSARLYQLTRNLSGKWHNLRYRDELMRQALSALHLFQRDRDYSVQNGEVVLIDANTGRRMPDRRLSHGVHQMIEAKEGCRTTAQAATIARVSYQQFFRRYHHLTGMSGTLAEVRPELAAVYGLDVGRVPPRTAVRRTHYPSALHPDLRSKRQAVIHSVRIQVASGRPVLVGTGSVAESEQVSRWLSAAGIEHCVLNAKQDADEARIVSLAGTGGRVTVSTNMAGRGTDISLATGVAERGGLHVLATHINDARRIDRQLYGRCARQGDPGSCELIVSLQDSMLARFFPAWLLDLIARWMGDEQPLAPWLAALIVRVPQQLTEARQERERRQLQKQDARMKDLLALAGSVDR